MFEVPQSVAASTTSNLTAQLADAGTLTLVVLVAAIPLTFYVIKKVIGLFPKGK